MFFWIALSVLWTLAQFNINPLFWWITLFFPQAHQWHLALYVWHTIQRIQQRLPITFVVTTALYVWFLPPLAGARLFVLFLPQYAPPGWSYLEPFGTLLINFGYIPFWIYQYFPDAFRPWPLAIWFWFQIVQKVFKI